MEIIEQHFAAENAHDVAATLATYTEDVVWDDVGNPACPVCGKSAAAEMYEGIMDGIPDLHLGRWAASSAETMLSTRRSRPATFAARSSASRAAVRQFASGYCTFRYPRRPDQSRAGVVRHRRGRSPGGVLRERYG